MEKLKSTKHTEHELTSWLEEFGDWYLNADFIPPGGIYPKARELIDWISTLPEFQQKVNYLTALAADGIMEVETKWDFIPHSETEFRCNSNECMNIVRKNSPCWREFYIKDEQSLDYCPECATRYMSYELSKVLPRLKALGIERDTVKKQVEELKRDNESLETRVAELLDIQQQTDLTFSQVQQQERERIKQKIMTAWRKHAQFTWGICDTKNMPKWVREALDIPKIKNSRNKYTKRFPEDQERDIALLREGKIPTSVYYGAEKHRDEDDVKYLFRREGRKYYK